MSLFDKPGLGLSRQRRPRNVQLPPTPSAAAVDPVLPAFQDVLDVAQKAQILEDEIVRVSQELTIPVAESAIEVRSAVLRRDKPSGGSFITFDLYMDALRSKEAARNLTAQEIRTVIDFSGKTNQKALSELVFARRADVSIEDAGILQSQALYLFTLQMMQGGLQALETQRQTAVKFPLGTESGPTIASIVLSIAFLLEYTSNGIDTIKRVFKDVSEGSVDVDALAELAKKTDLSKHPLIKMATESKKPGDFDLILEYAHNFLTSTDKVGYEAWLLLPDVRSIRAEMQLDLKQGDRYIDGGAEVDPAVFKLIQGRATAFAHSLDFVASSLADREPTLAQLCSIEWLAKLPLAALRLLQSVYQVLMAMKSIEFSNLAKVEVDGPGFLWDILHDGLNLFSQTAKKLLCWFQRDPDVWRVLEQCPPIAEMVNAAITALEEIESWFFAQIDGAVEYMAAKARAVTFKSQFLLELRKLRVMLQKTEYVIQNAARVQEEINELRRLGLDSHEGIASAYKNAFEQAAEQIKIRFEEKPSRLKDFVKREFTKSNFIFKGPQGIVDTPFDTPTVPFGACDFSPNQNPHLNPLSLSYYNRTGDAIDAIGNRSGQELKNVLGEAARLGTPPQELLE